MFGKLKDKTKEKTEKVTKKIGESAKELKDKAKESVKGIQESFDKKEEKIESNDGEKYSDEEKQRELAELNKLVIKAENIIEDWENKGSEATEAIQKLKEYRDEKSVIWESYNNHTKNEESPAGQAAKLLDNLKEKSNKKRESSWGFKEKFQELKFTKGNKEAESLEEIVVDSKVEKMNEMMVKENEKVSKEIRSETISKSVFSSFGETKQNFLGSIEGTTKNIGKSVTETQESTLKSFKEKYKGVEETIKNIRELKIVDIWEELKKRMKQHKPGKEENIELKYRINEIQTKPEARLWLAHLLCPIHGERVRIEIEVEFKKEDIENKFAEKLKEIIKEHHIKAISLTDKEELLIKHSDNGENKVVAPDELSNELKTIKEYLKTFSGNKRILHGIIISKKDESGNQERKFFQLEESYNREKELYEDTYYILWRSLIKGGIDKLTISEDRMKRVIADRITSDLTSLNFLGFKRNTIESFASGLASASQALSVSKWLTNNSFLILTDLLNRWDAYLLGNVDTPPAFNIRTAFSYSLIYETKIVKRWKEEFEKVCYELEDKSAELNIVELPKYTFEQKKEIAQKIIRELFKKYRKETKERSHEFLVKIANKVSKALDKEDGKFLEVIDRSLEDLITETWEERGTRKLRFELNRKFSLETLEKTFREIVGEELNILHKETSYFQKQIKKLEELHKKNKEESNISKLNELKIELKNREDKIEKMEEKSKLVAQIEVK